MKQNVKTALYVVAVAGACYSVYKLIKNRDKNVLNKIHGFFKDIVEGPEATA